MTDFLFSFDEVTRQRFFLLFCYVVLWSFFCLRHRSRLAEMLSLENCLRLLLAEYSIFASISLGHVWLFKGKELQTVVPSNELIFISVIVLLFLSIREIWGLFSNKSNSETNTDGNTQAV